jgi:hypothetical protein
MSIRPEPRPGEQPPARRWRWVLLLAVAFIAALAIDVGLGINQVLCDDCSPPSGGQKAAFPISACVAAALAVFAACWARVVSSTVLLMIAVVLILHWALIVLPW